MLLELGADVSDDTIASCQVHQGFGISSCRCSTPQSSPSPATAWAEGRQFNGAPFPCYTARMSIPASIHTHACTSVRPGSLASEEVRKQAGNVLEFRKLGK